jgi:hypothetical protein
MQKKELEWHKKKRKVLKLKLVAKTGYLALKTH